MTRSPAHRLATALTGGANAPTAKGKRVPNVRKPAPPAPAFEDVYYDQQSPEWFEVRRGVPTASNFSKIMAQSEERAGRTRYLNRLAGELITGLVAEEGFKSKAMERGNEMEPRARDHYARTNLVPLHRVGFCRRKLRSGTYVGCSPDSLIGEAPDFEGALEIKTMIPELMIPLALSGRIPTEHRAQCHGTMWVRDLKFVDLVIYYDGMPSLKYRLIRDEEYIKQISDAVEVFDYELRQLVAQLKKMGGGR